MESGESEIVFTDDRCVGTAERLQVGSDGTRILYLLEENPIAIGRVTEGFGIGTAKVRIGLLVARHDAG